jgi:hypothetical protein
MKRLASENTSTGPATSSACTPEKIAIATVGIERLPLTRDGIREGSAPIFCIWRQNRQIAQQRGAPPW